MDSRERVLRAIHHQEPDRVPTFFRRHSIPGQELSVEQMAYVSQAADVGPYLNMRNPANRIVRGNQGDISYDELGIGRRYTGLYWDIVDFPLAYMEEPEELLDYPWPQVFDAGRTAGMRAEALQLRAQGKATAVMGSWGGSTGIFEMSWYMRGMDNFLVDLMINRPFAEALLDIQLELHKRRWKLILEEVHDVADLVCIGDDLATQANLLISPDTYRTLIKPRQKELIDYIKTYTGASVYYHSCGAIEPLVADLMEIGVDVLDPVQPSALDIERLKDRYGRQLAFFGGVDVQNVLPFGSPRDVKEEVLTRFRQMGENGGLILGPSHWIQTDTPWENIHAMYEAIRACEYPFNPGP